MVTGAEAGLLNMRMGTTGADGSGKMCGLETRQLKKGQPGPEGGSYVPPHARNNAGRSENFGARPNRTSDSRW